MNSSVYISTDFGGENAKLIQSVSSKPADCGYFGALVFHGEIIPAINENQNTRKDRISAKI